MHGVQQVSTQSISAVEAFFKRHQDNPKLYRIIYGVAAFFWLYGFVLFNVAGYHRATALDGYYAELGLFVLGLLFMFSGAMIFTIRYRKDHSDFRSPAHSIVFHFKIAALPLIVGLALGWIPVALLWTNDSYMELTVKATEPVKKDLKWLLGDLYPGDQENNINPETLEWTMVLAKWPGRNYWNTIQDNSPWTLPEYIEDYQSKQLNVQKFEATWFKDGQEMRETLSVDWNKAELFGYNQTERKDSYPICDLRAPLITKLPKNRDSIRVIINNKLPENHLVNHTSFGFLQPSYLPDMMRIEGDDLVVRTNFAGGAWGIYCLYNFPKNNRQHLPEPMTSKTIGSLNHSDYKLHFVLFPGIHLNNAILSYKEHSYIRRSTSEEYFENIDAFVAHSILKTSRSKIVTGKIY